MFPGLRKRRPTWTFFEETRKNHFCWKSLQAKNIRTFFGNSKNVSKFLAEFFDRLFDSPTVRWMLTFPYFNILPNLRSTESFFLKWANLGLFFAYFRSFQTNTTIFTTNICEKMSIQYTAPGFKPTTFGTWVLRNIIFKTIFQDWTQELMS